MIVRVDPRVGSKHMLEPLKVILGNAHDVRLKQMRAGDVSWRGCGPDACPRPRIRVELKNVADLCGSLASRRLIEHQVPELMQSSDIVYIVVEGLWRPHLTWKRVGPRNKHAVKDDRMGRLDIYAGGIGHRGWTRAYWRPSGWQYVNIIKMLATLQATYGIRVVRTASVDETLFWLAANIEWWAKPWSEHRSGEAWSGMDMFGQLAKVRKPSRVERFAMLLDGVGKDKLRTIARHFRTIRAAVNAEPEEWVGLRPSGTTKTGRRKPGITLTSAQFIQRQLDEPHKERSEM